MTKLVRRTKEIRALAATALLGIPIIALNTWIIHKAPLTLGFFESNAIWIAMQCAASLLTSLWIFRASWIGFWFFALNSFVAIGVNVIQLLRTKNYALAFFALFLVVMCSLFGMALFRTLKRVYLVSGRRWYEGLPRLLPKIVGEVKAASSETEAVQLSQLSVDGCFVVTSAGTKPKALSGDISLTLKLDDRMVACGVELISVDSFKDLGTGLGFRFKPANEDEQKDIFDFVERVRSVGYVE